MATPTTTTKLLLVIGDGADPEVFGSPCGVSTRGLQMTKAMQEQLLLDCDDPQGEPAYMDRQVTSDDTIITFSGLISVEYWPTWLAWINATGDAVKKNIRAGLDLTAAQSGGYWAFPGILNDVSIAQEGKASVTINGTISGAGARTWVANT